MIGQIQTGSNFGGLFRYLLSPDKKARIIYGNVAGIRPSQLRREFSNCADIRPTTQKPVKHKIVSFAPNDGEVALDIKAEIAKRVIIGLGYTRNQYIVIDHHRDDPGHDWNHDHDHIHIVVNMITIDGRRINDHQDKRRFESILRELEKEFGLTQVAPSWETDRRSPSHGQKQRYKREVQEYEAGERDIPPELPVSEKLQDLIEDASNDQPTMSEYARRLQNEGVEVRPRITRNNIVQGISYCLDDVKFPGSKLGNASFPKLQSKRGVEYDPERDISALKQAAAGELIEVETAMEAAKRQAPNEAADDNSNAISSGSGENNATDTTSDDSSNQNQSEMVREVAALTNALLYLRKTNHIENSNWKITRASGILQLWEKSNAQPIMTAIADHNQKTWNDTGESQLTPEIVAQFTKHLSPVLEEARALREEKQKQKQKRQLPKHSLRKRKHLGGGLEL